MDLERVARRAGIGDTMATSRRPVLEQASTSRRWAARRSRPRTPRAAARRWPSSRPPRSPPRPASASRPPPRPVLGTSPSSVKSRSASTSARHVSSSSRQPSTAAPSAPSELPQRLAPLRLRLRVDQVAEPFRRRVRSSLPLRKARRVNSPGSAGRTPENAQSRRSSAAMTAPAAVDMQLRHVLPGEARRPRKPQHERRDRALAARRVAAASARTRRRRGAGAGPASPRGRAACRARRRASTAIAARPGRSPGRRWCRVEKSSVRIDGRTTFVPDARAASRHDGASDEPARQASEPLSAAAQGQSRRTGGNGARRPSPRRSAAEPADPALGRLRRLPLVPRHGARELRGLPTRRR